VLVKRSIAVCLGNEGLDVPNLNLQTFIQVFQCVVEAMLSAEYLGPEDERVKVFRVVMQGVG
jgi:hypothetical protein